MSHTMPKVKITVLKRTLHQDLIDVYLDEAYKDTGLCECFEEGEEFVIDPAKVPNDVFARCAWAWADIRKDILAAAMGANMPGIKQPGTFVSGCTDWLRPVIFQIKRLDEEQRSG